MSLVQVQFLGENEALFDVSGKTCNDEDLQEIFQEWFNLTSEDKDDQAELHLMRWGIERVYIEETVHVELQ